MILKCLLNKSFAWVISGQVIAAMGWPFLCLSPSKLATNWFGADERVIATTIATASQPLGVAIGFAFPTIFVRASDEDPGDENVVNARHHLF